MGLLVDIPKDEFKGVGRKARLEVARGVAIIVVSKVGSGVDGRIEG